MNFCLPERCLFPKHSFASKQKSSVWLRSGAWILLFSRFSCFLWPRKKKTKRINNKVDVDDDGKWALFSRSLELCCCLLQRAKVVVFFARILLCCYSYATLDGSNAGACSAAFFVWLLSPLAFSSIQINRSKIDAQEKIRAQFQREPSSKWKNCIRQIN